MIPPSTTGSPGWRTLSLTFEAALARLPEALAREGFGVITQIDMQATFLSKLGVAFPPYRIIGACNPTLALRALQHDPQLGVLLPCNVVLYEQADGRAVIGAVDPVQTLGAHTAGGPLAELALEVAGKLERVIAELAA